MSKLTKEDLTTIEETVRELQDDERFTFSEVPMETVVLSNGYADVYATGEAIQHGVVIHAVR